MRKTAADHRLQEAVWSNILQQEDETRQVVEAREFNQIIQKAINQLPPQRRLIYRLNREEGLKYQEIADKLCISRHTVKNQLFNALQTIRNFLACNARSFFFFF